MSTNTVNNKYSDTLEGAVSSPSQSDHIGQIEGRCRLCGNNLRLNFKKSLLQKYNVSYYECTYCHSLQTEVPYWLDEAYGPQAEKFDTGKASRTLINFLTLPSLLSLLGVEKHNSSVDWGGGSGLLTRLLRDIGYDFYSYDKYSTSEFAQGFLWCGNTKESIAVVTAFELAEHFTDPIIDWGEMFRAHPDFLICSTQLYAGQGENWDYLSPENGQHVFFYSELGLAIIAAHFGYTVYKIGTYQLFCRTPLHTSINLLLAQWLNQNIGSRIKVFEEWIAQPYRYAMHDSEILRRIVPQVAEKTVVIDTVFFQINNSGIARVWETLLQEWSVTPFSKQIVIVNRIGTAPRVPGFRYVDAPAYDYGNVEADRTCMQKICDDEGAVLFISTYYTTSLTTPSLMMVYDLIPEVMGWDLSQPMWREKQRAIGHASKYVCISETTANDLKRIYGIPADRVIYSHCGVNPNFTVASKKEVQGFLLKYKIRSPYFLLVGERGAHKNIGLFFRGLALLGNHEKIEVICLGGRSALEPELLALAGNTPVRIFRVSDDEMRTAYSGAIALVYPSLYEGFGMPIIEAMACGCPVITCRTASIPEIAGENVLYVSTTDEIEMASALKTVRLAAIRKRLVKGGLKQAGGYSWRKMADTVGQLIQDSCNSDEAQILERDIKAAYQQTEEAVNYVVANPYGLEGPSKLAAARAKVTSCLLLTGVSLPIHLSGPLGKAHIRLLDAGIAQIATIDCEAHIVARITEILAHDPKKPVFLCAWASVMMYASPYRIKPLPSLVQIPSFLQERFRKYLFTNPQIFIAQSEVEIFATYFTELMIDIKQGVELTPESPVWNAMALDFVNMANMIPLYFSNSSLKVAQQLRAFIVEYIIARHSSSPGLDYTFPIQTAARKKIRFGVLAAHFRPQTETYATLPVYRDLDRDRFEIILISQVGFGAHHLEQYCSGYAEHAVELSLELAEDVKTIRELDLDVLWIGTNLTAVVNYMVQLSVHRLARLQVVGGCCSATTGFRNIDMFISGAYTEHLDAAQHYTEKLLLVDGPAHCFDMKESTSSPVCKVVTRSTVTISESATVYASGANFFKIIPELLEAWLDILAKVPNSRMILYPFNPNWTSKYPVSNFTINLERASKNKGFSASPFIIVPPMPSRSDILQLLRIADIYLDSFPYSGMTSILDPYDAGLPIVALEGEYQRERMSSSALRCLGFDDWITTSRSAYVERAVMIGKDVSLRESMHQQLENSRTQVPKFLDVRWFGQEIEKLFTTECKT